MKKQTAVDFLWTKASSGEHLTPEDFEQAKAMEREQMLKLISFVRMHNKMGKSADDLLQEFETYKKNEQ